MGRSGNDLHYRGYDILDFADQAEFEEVAYLLVHEKLPNSAAVTGSNATVTTHCTSAAARSGPAPVPVTATVVEKRDVPVRLRANGTVVALQSVDLRAQTTSIVREVLIKDGQVIEHNISFD